MSGSTKSRLLLALAWAISLVIATTLGWKAANQGDTGRTSSSETAPRSDDGQYDRTSLESSLGRLQAENARLKRTLEKLRRELAGRDVDEQRQQSDEERKPVEVASVRTDYYLDRLILSKRKGGFLSGLEEAIELAIHVARAGEAGIERMKVLALEADSSAERELAIQILSFIPSRTALDSLMVYPWRELEDLKRSELPNEADGDEPPDEGGQDARWEWEAVLRHVESLPKTDLAGHMGAFRERLDTELREGVFTKEGQYVCAHLGFRLGDLRARQIFDSLWSGLERPHRAELAEYLTFVESPESRDFLRRVGSSDSDPDVREIAREGAEFLTQLLDSDAKQE